MLDYHSFISCLCVLGEVVVIQTWGRVIIWSPMGISIKIGNGSLRPGSINLRDVTAENKTGLRKLRLLLHVLLLALWDLLSDAQLFGITRRFVRAVDLLFVKSEWVLLFLPDCQGRVMFLHVYHRSQTKFWSQSLLRTELFYVVEFLFYHLNFIFVSSD